jgi:hypothetical protein
MTRGKANQSQDDIWKTQYFLQFNSNNDNKNFKKQKIVTSCIMLSY